MAGTTQADGSITIDTKLDNTGFERGSAQLKHAFESLTIELDSTGKAMRHAFAFDFGQPKQIANTFLHALKGVNGEISDLGDLAQKAISGDSAALERFKQDSGDIMTQLEGMKAELTKFGEASFESPDHAVALKRLADANAEVDKLTTSLEEAEGKLDAITEDFGRSRALEDLEDKIEMLKYWQKEYDDAQKRGDKGAAFSAMMDSGVTKGTIAEALQAAEQEWSKMWATFESSGAYRSAESAIDKIRDRLKAAKDTAAECQKELDATAGSFNGFDSTEYEKDHEALEKAIDKLLEYRRLVRENTQEASIGAMIRDTMTAAFQGVYDKVMRVSDAFTGLTAAALRFARSGVTHAFDFLRRTLGAVATKAREAAAHIGGMIKSGIVSGLRKLGDAISKLHNGSDKSNMSMSKMFKSIIKYGLGIRSLYFLFNKLRRALMDGFTGLAAHSATLSTSITDLKTALATLKYSFAAAFAPIAEIVLPILTQMINAITTAVTCVGMLIAALTGKSTYTKVAAVQAGVTGAAGSAADALGDESAAAQELQKTLAGFDDVEILSAPDAGGSGGKGGKGGSGAGNGAGSDVTFEEVPIDSAFGDLAQKLKDAWANADFTEIGQMIGFKLKGALESIPWDVVRAGLQKVAGSLATLLNGFLETPGLFDVVGETIAEGIKSAFTFAETFVREFHWESLGTAIKTLIVNALSRIDWELIYQTMKEAGAGIGAALESALDNPEIWTEITTTLSNQIKALVIGVGNFLSAVDWASTGRNIGTGLVNGLNAIDWELIYATLREAGKSVGYALEGAFDNPAVWASVGTTIASGLNAVVYTAQELIDSIDWSGVGSSIATGLNAGVAAIDWQAVAQMFSDLVNGIVDRWYSFVTTFDFSGLGARIGTAVTTTIASIDWHKAGASLAQTANGLLNAISAFFAKVDWGLLGKKVVDGVKGFFDEFSWSSFGETLGGLARGLLRFLRSAIQTIKWDEIPGYITGAIKDFLTGFDWANLIEETIGLVKDAFSAFISLLSGGSEDGEESPVVTALNTLKATISKISTDDFTALATSIGSLVTSLKPATEGFATGLLTIFNGLAALGIEFIESLGPAIQAIADAIASMDPETLATIGTNLGKLAGVFFVLKGLEAAASVVKLVAGAIGVLARKPIGLIATALGKLGGIFTFIKGRTAAATAISKVSDALDGLKTIATTALTTAVDGISKAIGGIKAAADSAIGGAKAGGLMGLLHVLGYVIPAAAGVAAGMKLGELDIATDEEELKGWGAAYDLVYEALNSLKSEYGLTANKIASMAWCMTDVKTDATDLGTAFGWLETRLESNGISADAFYAALDNVMSLDPDQSKIAAIQSAINGIGTSATSAETNTADLAQAFDLFSKSGFTAPVKFGILRTAVSNLGNTGKLTIAQTNALYSALNSYQADPTEENLGKVETAFQDTGLSAGDFLDAVVKTMTGMNGLMIDGFEPALKKLSAAATELKKRGAEGGENVGSGLVEGMENKEAAVSTEAASLIDDSVLDTMDTHADSHSPSKETAKRGGYLVDGLMQGMRNGQSALVQLSGAIIDAVKSRIDGFRSAFRTVGAALMQDLRNGMSTASYALVAVANGIVSSMIRSFSAPDWQSIGSNIGSGIYNGLSSSSGRLSQLAQETATRLKNAACNALGIHSPSTEFEWIGEMMGAGLEQGVDRSRGTAVSAVTSLADAVIREAEDGHPSLLIGASVDSLGNALSSFSDRIVSNFDAMISAMERIVSGASFTVPAVAGGTVMPYLARRASVQDDTDTISAAMDRLAQQGAQRLTREDLTEILTNVCSRYLNIDFYLGDEQIARHANAGNARLNRRFSAVSD